MSTRLPAPRCWRQQLSLPLRPSSLRQFSTTSSLPVKSGWSTLPPRARPTRFNQPTSGLPLPTTGPAAALKRKAQSTPIRTGVLAIKKGMTAFMGRTGARIPCTVLQLDRVQTLLNKTRKDHGYWAVQVGLGARNPANVGAPMLGYYEAKGVAPKEILAEFRVRDENGLLPVGVELKPDWFYIGQRVDVRSNSRGQGFAGGMKRHGFSGQEASHGNSKNHRTIGSVGPSQGSGSRVLPGKKMPGRMGNERVTVQNLPILMIDNDLGIVVVKGAVAGPKGAIVKIQDAVKKPPPPKEFVEKTLAALKERFPKAEEHLQAAREKHLELKAARREKKLEELLGKKLWEPTEKQRKIVEDILAMEKGEAAGKEKRV
ncbi:translation protein [Podospora fimiseda]|uniref:Large ribosomal subunit protein uL3m n=1 Tax=Podospora fimiseda TaxID=252190 RepID=A0AAN7BRQ4_9PEZI|nr:translation protein [Podospora fimiseda]